MRSCRMDSNVLHSTFVQITLAGGHAGQGRRGLDTFPALRAPGLFNLALPLTVLLPSTSSRIK